MQDEFEGGAGPPSEVRSYRPGERVFEQGDACRALYWIEHGTVAVRKVDGRGNVVFLRIGRPRQPLGYRAFIGGSRYAASAEVLTPARVRAFDRDAAKRRLVANPELAAAFLSRLALDLARAEEMRLALAYWPMRDRVLHALLLLGEQLGAVEHDGFLSVDLPFDRRDLAAVVPARPVALSRTLSDLEGKGIVRFTGRRMTIANPQCLRARFQGLLSEPRR